MKAFRILLIAAVIVAVLLIAVSAYGLIQARLQANAPRDFGQVAEQSANASGIFLDRDLGIAFQYGPGVETEATGTKVYVYEKGSEPASGQSVAVFKKDPKETFEAAIRRIALAGNSNDCTIDIEQTNKYEGGYMTAEIVPPTAASSPSLPAWANASLCNEAYAKTNGLRYFLYDTNHPGIFAFFDIGQYAIPSGEGNEPWEDTFRFAP